MDIVYFALWLSLMLAGIAGTITSPILALKHSGVFGKKEVVKYSASFGISVSLIVCSLIWGVSLLSIWFTMLLAFVLSLFISLQWLFSRYVAGKAEAAGRSYVAFLVVSILFPLIGLIIVLLFQPNSNVSNPSFTPLSTGNLTDDLTKLQSLKESGVLSEEEFKKAKDKLLS